MRVILSGYSIKMVKLNTVAPYYLIMLPFPCIIAPMC